MTHIRKLILSAAAVAVLAVAAPVMAAPAAAQDTAPTASAPATDGATPEKLAMVHRMFDAMHLNAMMGQMMQQMTPALMEGIRKSHPELTEADSDKMQKAMTVVMQVDQEYMPKITDAMAEAYAEVFTLDELTAIDAFYESGPGQALVAKTPQVMGRLMPIMTGFIPDMMAETQKRLCAEISCPAKADGAKTS